MSILNKNSRLEPSPLVYTTQATVLVNHSTAQGRAGLQSAAHWRHWRRRGTDHASPAVSAGLIALTRDPSLATCWVFTLL